MKTIRGRWRDPRVRKALIAILKRNALCAMATVGPKGRAHVNTAYYAFSPRLVFYFYSYSTSRHARNLTRNPSMALAVYDSTQVWGGADRGVQLFGECRAISGTRAREAGRVYGARFRGYKEWMEGVRVEESPSDLRAFRFDPTRATLFDERVFGGGIFVEIPLI